MNIRLVFFLLAGLVFASPAAVLADAGQQVAASPAVAPINAEALQPCPKPADGKQNVAQIGQVQCCKDHKGVCGCRAGKIVCCDGTVSTEPGCTCHGDDGFLE